MTLSRRIALGWLLVLVLASGGVAVMNALSGDPPPPVPADPMVSDVELVLAVPFTLDQPYTHWWRAERPPVDAGLVLVLAADPTLLHPRQGPEPILYVGAQTAERINTGHESGHLVVLVPSGRDASGQPDLDLGRARIFFGEPGLPEQVDGAAITRQVELARERGLEPMAPAAEAWGEAVHFVDDGDLRTWSADLVERYSPQEVDLVSGLRAPRLRR